MGILIYLFNISYTGKGHPESQADTDSFQKPVKFVIPDPNYYGTDPESKITKNVCV